MGGTIPTIQSLTNLLPSVCEYCNGTGYEDTNKTELCNECKGYRYLSLTKLIEREEIHKVPSYNIENFGNNQPLDDE